MSTKFYFLLLIALLSNIGFSSLSNAQHNDIQFEYIDNKIEILSLPTGVAETSFPTSGFFKQFTDDPGFLSEVDTGQGIGAGDGIVYNVLDNLAFWNGSAFALPITGTQLRIENNQGDDTLVSTTSGLQVGNFVSTVNLIDQATSSGDFHSHVDFNLEIDGSNETPQFGSYGIKLSISTTATSIADSDPFYIVFNFGIDAPEYEAGIEAFAALLTPSVLAGDFNDDGIVNAADYTVWRDNLNAPNETAINHAGDGLNGVDSADYLIWVDHYGETSVATPTNSIASIPEPSTIVLVTLVITYGLTYRNGK